MRKQPKNVNPMNFNDEDDIQKLFDAQKKNNMTEFYFISIFVFFFLFIFVFGRKN